jgi:hypothetical protein
MNRRIFPMWLCAILVPLACGGSAFTDPDAGLMGQGDSAAGGGGGTDAGSGGGAQGGSGGQSGSGGQTGTGGKGGQGGTAGAAGSAGGGGGPSCGSRTCASGEICCSASCGICTRAGGLCPGIACFDAGILDSGGPTKDAAVDCSALADDVSQKLKAARKCIPNGIVAECLDSVEGTCCSVVVAQKDSQATQDYLAALKTWKAKCPMACPAIACQPVMGTCETNNVCSP